MDFPEPVISLAIEPKTKADQEKLGVGLGKLMAEDPTFRVKTDAETGQVIISGMGELHLEIIVDRLKREFSVEAIGRQAAGRLQGDHHARGRRRGPVHQADGRPRPVRPREDPPDSAASRATGYVFENEIVGGSIPKEFIKPIDKGIKRSDDDAACSPATRWTTCAIELYDGSYHDVDSIGNGVQDRRIDGVQGRGEEGAVRCCSSR